MLRILADENFNQRILRGVLRHIPDLDFVIVQETEMEGADERLQAGEPVAGVIIVPKDMPIGIAVEELAILIGCSEPEEVENQVKYVPI